MGKYFLTLSVLKGPWDQVFTAFWQRYPNPYRSGGASRDGALLRPVGRAGLALSCPRLLAEGLREALGGVSGRRGTVVTRRGFFFRGKTPKGCCLRTSSHSSCSLLRVWLRLLCRSGEALRRPGIPLQSKHVLTEDILHREVTDDQKLLSRRLLTKTNRMPRWAEHFFPPNVGRHVYILEDSIVDLQNRTMTTFTWNINHARLMVVEERCVYRENPENSSWTEVKREAWVSSRLFGVSRAIQEFGLARFKSNVTNTTKGFEYVLSKMQGEAPSKTLVETAKETALAVTEKAKDFAGKAATTKKQQYV